MPTELPPGSLSLSRPSAPAAEPQPDRPWAEKLRSTLLRTLSNLRRSDMFGSASLRFFRACQAAGFNVVPNHFYWPIPDLRTLEKQSWRMRNCALELNLESQARFAQHVGAKYSVALHFPNQAMPGSASYHRNNGFFETVDAEVAYCMVREHKPQRIIEIGGGFSTRVIAAAVTANHAEGRPCELTTIEPHPDAILRQGFPGMSCLIAKRVQEVPLELFASLEAGDILFIDSSHVVTVGSDVVHEFFEILPRLPKGVIIHLHDIFYPSDYPRHAVLNFQWFWSEQYLLEALLTSNPGFEVLWASSAMHLLCPQVLQESFPEWDDSYSKMPHKIRRFVPTADQRRVWPSSFWMRKTA